MCSASCICLCSDEIILSKSRTSSTPSIASKLILLAPSLPFWYIFLSAADGAQAMPRYNGSVPSRLIAKFINRFFFFVFAVIPTSLFVLDKAIASPSLVRPDSVEAQKQSASALRDCVILPCFTVDLLFLPRLYCGADWGRRFLIFGRGL